MTDIMQKLILLFSSTYNKSTDSYSFSLLSLLIDHSTTIALLYCFFITLFSITRLLKNSKLDKSSLFSPVIPPNLKSTLASSFIMAVSYVLSSAGMHTYSLFNTGQPSGAEIYLFFIAMDSLTIMFLVFAHTYIRCRYSFQSEWFSRIMIASAASHLLLYVASINYFNGSGVWVGIYDFSAILFVLFVNGGSIVLIAMCLMPKLFDKTFRKLKSLLSFKGLRS